MQSALKLTWDKQWKHAVVSRGKGNGKQEWDLSLSLIAASDRV